MEKVKEMRRNNQMAKVLNKDKMIAEFSGFTGNTSVFSESWDAIIPVYCQIKGHIQRMYNTSRYEQKGC